METSNSDRLAVLIDADNAQPSIVDQLLAEISRYGIASVKRAYGDWTTPNLAGWKQFLHKHAIQPVQQFAYTSGKNATDSALIIDAMDLLHAGGLNGFCLVSSDSDFTRLATRIREAGVAVYGFGEAKTPEPFVSACDRFIYTEILRPKVGESTGPKELANVPLADIILPAIDASARENGWAPLSVVGSFLQKTHPSFDPRNYGSAKLGELVRRQPFLEVSETQGADGTGIVHLSVRTRKA